ncbi:MAG: ThiF family adenylyltransferase [Aestuariivita sp.]|nr:ThiF family adenylyltransferase [Aestuariivita sp.]
MKIEHASASNWLIRPSVSFIPLSESIFDFFQSSTRRSFRFRLRPEIVKVIMQLDGKKSITEICAEHDAMLPQVENFLKLLHERCVAEPKHIRDTINNSEFHRILNFLGDYFPANELLAIFDRLRSATIAILGCGAVGSQIAIQLAHSGFQHFVIIDNDIVEESNLNRSIFRRDDIGVPKVQALKSAIHRISPSIQIKKFPIKISAYAHLESLLLNAAPDIIVNCADEPSVDMTSEWINSYCHKQRVPYVIAGGYNLHLSLIGMTVSPGVSACFNCSRITLNELEHESLNGIRRLWRPKRNLGSLAPLTGITSSLAASEVLRLAVRSERLVPAMWNRRGEYNFLTNTISFVDLFPRQECGCVG